jgi:hypothetical protein
MSFDPLEVRRGATLVTFIDEVPDSHHKVLVENWTPATRLPAVLLPALVPHLTAVDRIVTVGNDLDIAFSGNDFQGTLHGGEFGLGCASEILRYVSVSR